MRLHLFYILPLVFILSCAKQPSTDPVPALTFKYVDPLGKTKLGSTLGERDTATLVFHYEDGDGDLFRNNNNDGANLIYTTYVYQADSDKFVVDGISNPATITQPANGAYKGKSIFGDIYVPMRQFRSSDKIKIFKFEAFMLDMKGHKSNVISSPVYTLTN